MIAVHVTPPVPRVQLLSNEITLLTYGGVLSGWARVIDPRSAADGESIAVSGGWLQIAPFLSGRRLHSRTETVDLVVIPGSAAGSAVALRPARMWDKERRPVAPAALAIALMPVRFMTIMGNVDASVQFHFTAMHTTGAHEHWECSIESLFPLVDRESALPDLWELRDTGGSATSSTLMLYSPTMGAFRALFPDPATAAGFARWMAQTGARRAGKYELGFMQPRAAAGFERIEDVSHGNFVVQQYDPR